MTGHCLSRQRHHHHHCWSTEVHIWDIIGEVVKLCMYPAPHNPFAVDMDYFFSLSTHQQVLATAAMMVCLQKIVLHTSDCPNLAPSPLYRDNMSRHPGTTCRRVCEFAGFVSSGRVYTINRPPDSINLCPGKHGKTASSLYRATLPLKMRV